MGKTWTGNTRAPWHDYTKRKIYHITLKKSPGIPLFGSLAGDWHLPKGTYGRSYIHPSPLGIIIKNCLKNLPAIHPALRLYQYALMPDHLHLIISVEYDMDEILGRKIGAFKVMVNKKANLEKVFEKGFNDQILTISRNLNVIYDYLRDNPFRLAVRFAHPEFFSRVNQIKIDDKTYATYGNFQLLHNPFKEQVVVHRADSAEIRNSNRQKWIYTAANGGVLVSPFISQAEKDIRAEAEALGGRTILITHESFTDRFKPAAHDFELCSQGRLLIISIGLPVGTTLSRSHCLQMNSLASRIVNPTPLPTR